ncbi:MAG TPA: helical backbone metal receptor, partial [Candidatus Dormibacteraeota bacterium]|nr:helical backbone metal receptor [Candidatus Dormibacteraeota bacterium]
MQDELGRTVRIPRPVNRIVSLAPSLTETVYALGQQAHLVGDTDYCDYPPEAKSISKVGGVINPS